MKETPDQDIAEFTANRMRARYIVALGLIALLTLVSQWVIQHSLAAQEHDSRVVNIAGRQRMLSQKITKTSLYLQTAESASARLAFTAQLRDALSLWTQSHLGLQHGDAGLGLPGNNSPEILALFSAIEPDYAAMVAAVERIIARPDATPDLTTAVAELSMHEAPFLAGMDAIVFRYDSEAKRKVNSARYLEIGLAALTLIVLVLEARLIFAPAVRRMRHDMHRHEVHEADMERLFSSNPTAMFLVDEHTLNISRGNGKAEALMSCSPNGYIDHPLCEFIDAKFEANRSFLEKIRAGDPLNEYEVVLLDARRSVVEALASACRISYAGQNRYVIGITDISAIKKAQQTLQYYATFDEMTGLVNRRTGLLMLATEMGRARRDKRPLTVCYVDLDRLKQVNDTFGHHEGDWVIKALSGSLAESIRDGDVAIRLGGDEFLLVLHDCSRESAAQLIGRIEQKLRDSSYAKDCPYQVSASFGLVIYDPLIHLTPEILVDAADKHMYEVKHGKQAGTASSESA
jgi:diguanylate cyclase (GGDEF)-like protein